MIRRVLPLLALLTVVAGCSTAPLSTPGAGGGGLPDGPVTARLVSDDPAPVASPTPQLPVTRDSADGRRVTVSSVQRIVAFDLYGTYATTVFALGLGQNLVGRDIAASFPAARGVPVVDPDGTTVNVESVLALRPTVVLTDASLPGAATARRQLIAAGVPVVMFDRTRSVANTGALIQSVADALGVAQAGTLLVQRTNGEIAQARRLAGSHTPKPEIAFVYARGTGLMLLGGPGSGADSLEQLIGGQDAGTAAGLTAAFTSLTAEGLVKAAPDVILVMTDGLASVGGVDGLLKVPGVAETPAGAHRRIVDMADGVLLSFGPRTGEVALALARALYGRR
jgi:iron complex transport system substrate-binding protein